MRFVLDAPVQDGKSATYRSGTGDAPLAQALFAINGVEQVQVTGPTIAITRAANCEWPQIKAYIAAAIREVLNDTDHPLGTGSEPTLSGDAALLAKVTELLDLQANPSIAAHGGHVSAEQVKDGVVHLRMSGGCQGCSASSATLRDGVETMLRAALPSIRQIIDVTDHSAGTTPFYQASSGNSPLFVRPVPADVIITKNGETMIDPAYLAPRLGLNPEQLRSGLSGGAVAISTESDIGPDRDRTRVTVRSTQRAWAAEILPDGSAREVPPARRTDEQQPSNATLPGRVRAYLDALPAHQLPITYGALARGLNMYAPGSVRRVTAALEVTMLEDTKANRPFTAARAVGRGPARLPGKGFFEMAQVLGHAPAPSETQQEFHQRHLTQSLATDQGHAPQAAESKRNAS